jgi:hypothetical protein
MKRSRLIRDVAEVVAIVLAGAWAIYTFAWQNLLVPAIRPPSLDATVQMRHVGNEGSLAVIRLDETLHNTGINTVYFLGYSITVLGTRVRPSATPQAAQTDDGGNTLETYYTFSKPTVVYRDAFITQLANPAIGRDLFLYPGQVATISREFYVPRAQFQRLVTWLVTTYTKDDRHTIPTTMTIEPSGRPHFESRAPHGVAVYMENEPLAELDLAE